MRYHFIGIGGIGMSGIAKIMLEKGYTISGSDLSANDHTRQLKEKGALIFEGHNIENIRGADIAVVSSDIREDNPELKFAYAQGIRVVSRAKMLAHVIEEENAKLIAISGSHGKTTTTALCGALLQAANFCPTIVNGGVINSFSSNACSGKGDWFVIEADESDASCLSFRPDIAIVTNVDYEHVDHYPNIGAVCAVFQKFLSQSKKSIVCYDDPFLRSLNCDITYGFSKDADFEAINIQENNDHCLFDISRHMKGACLAMLGRHNISNALAVVALGYSLGIDPNIIKQVLGAFQGIQRRFTYRGMFQGAKIIDDYAHHPNEVDKVINSARQSGAKRVISVMQPHRYTRLAFFMDDFGRVLSKSDIVILAPVYSARENPIQNVTSQHLAAKVSAGSVYTVDNELELQTLLKQIVQKDDIVLCMGAGTITQWSKNLAA